jgi:hypothetical protein
MISYVLIVVGLLGLLYFAVLVGCCMDTERQRIAARELAAQRRACSSGCQRTGAGFSSENHD